MDLGGVELSPSMAHTGPGPLFFWSFGYILEQG
jgi:hypothetical protein